MGFKCKPGPEIIALIVVCTSVATGVLLVIGQFIYCCIKKHLCRSENSNTQTQQLSSFRRTESQCDCVSIISHHDQLLQQQQHQQQLALHRRRTCSVPALLSCSPNYYCNLAHNCLVQEADGISTNFSRFTPTSVNALNFVGGKDVDPFLPQLTHNQNSADSSYVYDPNFLQATYNAGYPIEMCLREMYQVTERSLTRNVCNKLIVSVTHLVTDAGDTLFLDNMGISLTVPSGAVETGKKQLISLVLNWDLSDNPYMTEQQSLVGPLVYCGPHGLKLKKSCLLAYKHCAFNTEDLKIMMSETELTGQKDWRDLEKVTNHDDEAASSHMNVTQSECQVNITSFTLFTAVMTIREDCDDDTLPGSAKWLQLAVFSYQLQPNCNHYQARIYFLNKTPCALQWAIQNEAKFGGTLCCPEKVFLFDGSKVGHGKDMIVNTAYVSDDWEIVDDENADEETDRVPFLYIWHGKCPYASVCFRRQSTKPIRELSLQFHIFQETMEDVGEKLIVQNRVDQNNSKNSDQCRHICQKHNISQIKIQVSVDGHDHQQEMYGIANQLKCKRIPHELRLKLKLLLDPSSTFDKNWKALASHMNLDSSIRFMAEKLSPTEELLDILEQKMCTLVDLKNILLDIERLDAASEVEDFITKSDAADQVDNMELSDID